MASAKEQLVESFRQLDPSHSGALPRPVFEGVMREVCRASPAWLESLDFVLARVSGDEVHYEKFFEWIYGESSSIAAAGKEEGAALEEQAVPPASPAAESQPSDHGATVESPEEEPPLDGAEVHGDWSRYRGPSLESVLQVAPAEGHSAMRLVDARFLLELGGYEKVGGRWTKTRECGRMRRRQELPARAFLSLATLQRACGTFLGNGTLRILAVSYPWLQPDHPDPRGDSLTFLAYALASLINCHRSFTDSELLGIFIDFMSLHQKGAGTVRTSSEQRLFEAALEMLAELYSHPHTVVFKVSTLPEGYPDGFTFPEDCTPNKAAYYERGWCHCESSVAALSKSGMIVLDLGQLAATAQAGGLPPTPDHYETLRDECTAGRAAPLTPDHFAASLEQKSFTSKKADCPRVAAIYRAAFDARFGEATELWYKKLGWGDAEARSLAEVLASGAAPRLETLSLSENSIGDAGASALAQALSSGAAAAALKAVHLRENKVGDAGAIALADTLASGAAPRLEELDLSQNSIGDAGASALARALSSGAAAALKNVNLLENKVGDAGASALADALSSGAAPPLDVLELWGNRIGGAGLEALAVLKTKGGRGGQRLF